MKNGALEKKCFGRSAGAGLTLNHHPGPALFHSLFRRRCEGGDSRPRLSGREKLDGFFATTNAHQCLIQMTGQAHPHKMLP
jgi:hypothetical protein